MIRGFNGKKPKIAETAFISEAAYIVGDVEIGEYSNIFPGVVIRADMGKITIGRYTNVEDNCIIHSGSPTSDDGDVTIGDGVLIGHGAAVNCRTIGNNVITLMVMISSIKIFNVMPY